jgi:hypothetical protein
MFIQFLFIILLDDIKNLDNHVHLKFLITIKLYYSQIVQL